MIIVGSIGGLSALGTFGRSEVWDDEARGDRQLRCFREERRPMGSSSLAWYSSGRSSMNDA